jgi:hypothetical protein
MIVSTDDRRLDIKQYVQSRGFPSQDSRHANSTFGACTKPAPRFEKTCPVQRAVAAKSQLRLEVDNGQT